MPLARGPVRLNIVDHVEDDQWLIAAWPKRRNSDWAAKVGRERVLQGDDNLEIQRAACTTGRLLRIVTERDARQRSDLAKVEPANGACELEPDTRSKVKLGLCDVVPARRREQVGARKVTKLDLANERVRTMTDHAERPAAAELDTL